MNLSSSDVSKIINLKRAREYNLSTGVITYPSNFNILSQINSIVEEGFSITTGRVRSTPVKISGTSYIPPLPLESSIKEQLDDLLTLNVDEIDKTIELLFVMKKQIFLDGNKRTAVIFANHYLVLKGKGLIIIPAELVDE